MGINAKTWIPLAAAVVLGGIAAKTGYDVVAHRQVDKVVVQKVSRVVTAAEDIPAGAALRPEILTVSSVPESSATAGTFDAVERLTTRVTTTAVRKGQPVLDTVLAPEGTGRGLTAIVPEGMRAVTMEINEVSGVAGLILPGCRVDMVITFPGENGQMMTKTICQGLRVVAVGRNFTEPGREAPGPNGAAAQHDAGADQMAHSVTMLATPKEAELIDLASHTGTPRLILRSGRERGAPAVGMSDGVSVAELREAAAARANRWRTLVNTVIARIGSNPDGQAPSVKSPGPQVATDERKLSDPQNLFGQQPTTQPVNSRAVMVIRRTKEEMVQVPVDGRRPVGRESVFVNTETGEAIPGAPGDAIKRSE